MFLQDIEWSMTFPLTLESRRLVVEYCKIASDPYVSSREENAIERSAMIRPFATLRLTYFTHVNKIPPFLPFQAALTNKKHRPVPNQVRYEMNHHFRGAKLAYRFDFSSSCLLPEAHMSVEPGIFATFEMAPLEVLGFSVASVPHEYQLPYFQQRVLPG